jgi:uncharacterized protein (DUF1810 family)
MKDHFDLERFVEAQAAVYASVVAELRAGAKRSHWMWFIFPQMKGLGHSAQALHFGIDSLDEAEAYLRHPVLGARLDECTSLVNRIVGKSAYQIFDTPDEMKFRSSMTLFHRADPASEVFSNALEKYFGGVPDAATLQMLQRG